MSYPHTTLREILSPCPSSPKITPKANQKSYYNQKSNFITSREKRKYLLTEIRKIGTSEY